VRALIDQPYHDVAGMQLRFDMFRPNTDVVLPLVICIHGGGWISGDKESYRDVALGLVQAGFAAAIPQYRLAPLHPYPAAIEDIRTFVAFCRENAANWHVDPSKLASLGNSAGGYLAAMVGVGPSGYRVNAVVDICGITDLRDPRETHFPISWSFIEQFLPDTYEGNEAVFEGASPVCLVNSECPPFLVFHGEADDVVPVSQSEQLVQALRSKGVKVDYHPFPNEDHGFSGGSWPRMELTYTAWLKKVFAG
jgi:acetyl esterase/lipase